MSPAVSAKEEPAKNPRSSPRPSADGAQPSSAEEPQQGRGPCERLGTSKSASVLAAGEAEAWAASRRIAQMPDSADKRATGGVRRNSPVARADGAGLNYQAIFGGFGDFSALGVS